MKLKATILPALLAGLVWSCNPEQVSEDESDSGAPPAAPAAPSEEVLVALKGQEIGGKLLGNTVMLAGDKFVQADLTKAPDFYLVYYTASW